MKNYICINFVCSIASFTCNNFNRRKIFFWCYDEIFQLCLFGSDCGWGQVLWRTNCPCVPNNWIIYTAAKYVQNNCKTIHTDAFHSYKKIYITFLKQYYDDNHVINFLYILIFSITFLLFRCWQNASRIIS